MGLKFLAVITTSFWCVITINDFRGGNTTNTAAVTTASGPFFYTFLLIAKNGHN